MSDSDLVKLYSSRILALAADMPRTTRLAGPDATARRRSPLCGSTVTVDLKIAGDRIADYGQEVKACALGQASAAILGAKAVGLTEDQIRKGRDQLLAMLKENAPPPDPPFAELPDEWNALRVTTADGRVFTARGRGAGRRPTAESVWADLTDLAGPDG